MLHVEYIHSNADTPNRLENDAEFKLCAIAESVPESMFQSKELLDFAVKSYMENSYTHLSYENISDRIKKLSENFDAEDLAYVFRDLVSIDQQLYYDIMNMIINAIRSKDTCMLGEHVRNLRMCTDAEILAIMNNGESDGDCNGGCGSCEECGEGVAVDVFDPSDRDQYKSAVESEMSDIAAEAK